MMKEVTLLDKTFALHIREEEILRCVKSVAERLNKDYKGKTPLLLCILNGSFMFASDLAKELTFQCDISFTKRASYVGTQTTGKVQELIGIAENIEGRDVIIVEDIVDTGTTMRAILDSLADRKAASVKVCTLFFKPEKLVEDIPVDYVAMEIGNDFIVGYGLDYDGKGRNLRDVYILKC